MLSDDRFVQESLITNLFYLRTIREFCINIQSSFFKNNESYINQAEEYAIECGKLAEKYLSIANSNINEFALNSQILVTDYTLDSEYLTEKLFGVSINTEFTKKELALIPGANPDPSEEMINQLEEWNLQASSLVSAFIEFCTKIVTAQVTNELFSYSYPSLIFYMIEECSLYYRKLDQLIQKLDTNPTTVLDLEFWFNQSMRQQALFIRGLVDPSYEDVYRLAASFTVEYNQLLSDYQTTALTPENQQMLTDRSIELVQRFQTFIKELITNVLNAKLYFIVEPIFLDNMLTEANYFLYQLRLNESLNP